MNTWSGAGRLTRNPEIRWTQSGTIMAYFTLATHKAPDKNGEDADYIPCVAFGRLAELLKDYCQKGREVAVRGRIRTRNWADSKTGETIYKTEAVIEELDLMGAPRPGTEINVTPKE